MQSKEMFLALCLVLASMLLAGCLGTIKNPINDEDEENMEWISPELLLGNRVRSSPVLNQYDGCAELEEDLRNSLACTGRLSLPWASWCSRSPNTPKCLVSSKIL